MAARHYTVEDDGLRQPWEGRVWCNPPYGRAAAAWLKRMAEHDNGVALLFARTETEMFFNHVWAEAHSVLFLRGRIDFYLPDGTKRGNAGGPSVLIAYGQQNGIKLVQSRIPGVFLHLNGSLIIEGRCTQAEPYSPAEVDRHEQLELGQADS